MSSAFERIQSKKMGAFLGAAIGDAMGGPVESSHYKRIQQKCGPITGLVDYNEKYMLPYRFQRQGGPFHPGYALHPQAGSITDDTFCRKDICRFYLATQAPRTPEMLADWLLENGELDTQWPAWMVRALRWVQEGKVKASECGDTFKQGGGIGWWTPIGIFAAGDPDKAAAEVRKMCAIWKAPLERDFAAAVVACVAEGCKVDATYETMVEAMLRQCGKCARALLERAIRIAGQAHDTWDLAERIYCEMLMHETAALLEITPADPPTDADAPLPRIHGHLDYTDEPYTTYFWAEQIPIALAAFVFGHGKPESLPICINIGRDCDTTGTTIGAWLGALHGMDCLPKEWVDQVCSANSKEMDLMLLAQQICEVTL